MGSEIAHQTVDEVIVGWYQGSSKRVAEEFHAHITHDLLALGFTHEVVLQIGKPLQMSAIDGGLLIIDRRPVLQLSPTSSDGVE